MNAQGRNGQTALDHAIKKGNLDLCQMIILHDCTKRNTTYNQAIWTACCENHLELVDLLLQQGKYVTSGYIYGNLYLS